jgi:hypothetical protein
MALLILAAGCLGRGVGWLLVCRQLVFLSREGGRLGVRAVFAGEDGPFRAGPGVVDQERVTRGLPFLATGRIPTGTAQAIAANSACHHLPTRGNRSAEPKNDGVAAGALQHRLEPSADGRRLSDSGSSLSHQDADRDERSADGAPLPDRGRATVLV